MRKLKGDATAPGMSASVIFAIILALLFAAIIIIVLLGGGEHSYISSFNFDKIFSGLTKG